MTPTVGIGHFKGHPSPVHHQESELSPPEGLGGVARARHPLIVVVSGNGKCSPYESIWRPGSDSDTGGTP